MAVQLGSRWFWASRKGIAGSGLSPAVCFVAALLTVATFLIANWFLARRIEADYRNARIPEIAASVNTNDALDRAIAITAAPEELKQVDFIKNALRLRNAGGTATDQLAALLDGVEGKPNNAARQQLLRRHLTGRRRGIPGFAISATPPSGSAFFSELAAADPAWQRKLAAVHKERADAIRGFLVKYFDLTAQQVRPALRGFMRLNGPIQWLTIFVMFVVSLQAFRRYLLLTQLAARGWFPPARSSADAPLLPPQGAALWNTAGDWLRRGLGVRDAPIESDGRSAAAYAEAHDVREVLDRRVYPTMLFGTSVLPSLGFIGTVLGMGDALLQADALFHSVDKTAAIGQITSRLGFAFDTTLVGLLTGLVAGVCVLAIRGYEESLWPDVIRASSAPAPDGQPASAASTSPADSEERAAVEAES